MRKKLIMVILVFSFLFFSFSVIEATFRRMRSTAIYHPTTIILDAGHGGFDGGAVGGNGLIERDLVFNITQMTAENLRLQGFNVILTRTDAKDLASANATNRKKEDLAKRVELINQQTSAIAISIHANAIENERWRGAQTFYHPKSLENKQLASHLMSAMQANLPNNTRDARTLSHLYILKHAQIPTALVEVGFLSNRAEAALLSEDHYQELVAYAIFEGILAYFEALEVAD